MEIPSMDTAFIIAIIAAVPAMSMFLYMFDDKADHSGWKGYFKWLFKHGVSLLNDHLQGKDKPAETSSEKTPVEEEKKEESESK